MFKFVLTAYFLTKHMDQIPDKTLIPDKEKLAFSNKTYKSIKKSTVLYLGIG